LYNQNRIRPGVRSQLPDKIILPTGCTRGKITYLFLQLSDKLHISHDLGVSGKNPITIQSDKIIFINTTQPVTAMGVTGNNHVLFRSSHGYGTAAPATTTTATPIRQHVRHVVATQPDEKKHIRNLERV